MSDPVNHPSHYKAAGLEAIEIIELFGLNFHLGNVVKYVLRAGRKSRDSLTDLRKARWYLDRWIDRLEQADDVAKSTQVGLQTVRERMAAGGPGWPQS